MVVWHVQTSDGLVLHGAVITDGMVISEDKTKAELDGVVYEAFEGCILIEHETGGEKYDFNTNTFIVEITE